MADRKAQAPTANSDVERVLPASQESERYILGSILADPEHWSAYDNAGVEADDFHLESNRRILAAMIDLRSREEVVDRVTVTEELLKRGHLESVGGMGYMLDLDRDLPRPPSPAAYCKIVKEKAIQRNIIRLGHQMMEKAFLGEFNSAEILSVTNEQIQELSGKDTSGAGGKSPERIVMDYPGGLSAFLDPNLRRKGLPTGFPRLDEMTNGLHAGELTILGARPGVGKSAMALNIAQYLTMSPKQQRRVAIFSLEMTADSLITRLLCSQSRVDAHKFRAGFLNDEDRRKLQVALHKITEAPLVIYDRFGISMPEIAREVRRLTREEGCQLVILDYLQLVAVKRKGETRNLEISEMTRQLKIMAGECEIPIVVLSQLSRANEKRTGNAHEPILSDLRESGSIENDADNVFFLHREEMYRKDREDLKGLADLIIAKQRHGPLGKVPLTWLSFITRFVPRADPSDDVTQNT